MNARLSPSIRTVSWRPARVLAGAGSLAPLPLAEGFGAALVLATLLLAIFA